MSSLINDKKGFSLVECVIALLILMVVSLAIISVFNFSFRNSADARKRFAALLVAQERMEEVRNTPFSSLAAGTLTENTVIKDGLSYKVVRTITDTDLVVNTTTAPGPETKQITIDVTPLSSTSTRDTVTLTTFRAVNRPGPNRKSNAPES